MYLNSSYIIKNILNIWTNKYEKHEDDIMNEEIRIRKMKELSVTGRDTLESLKQAKIKLDSVKSWITIDGFGGSLLISIVKNTKIKETLLILEEAKKYVCKFQLQLKTIGLPKDAKNDVGVFVSFATFFLDDTLENHLIKENVSDVIEQLDDAIEMVDHICKELLKIF